MSSPIDPDFAKLAAQVASDQNLNPAVRDLAALGDSSKMWGEMVKFMPIGAAAMLSRIILSEEKVHWVLIIKKMFAASVCAVVSGLALTDYIQSYSLRMAAVGCLSFASPEVISFIVKWVKTKGDTEIAKVKTKKKAK